MEAKLSILFYAKKTAIDSGKHPVIYLRVTINGQRFEVTTTRSVDPAKWSRQLGKVKGTNEEARAINQYLDRFRQKVYDYERSITEKGQPFTKETLRQKWYGQEEPGRTLIQVFREHNHQLETLIGNGNSSATFTKYRTTLDHTINFLKYKFKQSDIEVSKITYNFITEFEFWLKSVQKCNHNTTLKYISNLRKIINLCLKNGWLVKDPFVGYKMTKKEVVRDILTEKELQTLIHKEIPNVRMRQIRDVFLFSCFTGLAYIDAKRLKRNEIITGVDDQQWISTRRKKTDSPTRIPLLPVVLDIMDVYKDDPQCLNNGSLLPVPSNAKLNNYLKELADLCGINKHLTFHIARHTFATTVTLNNGVPIETVSKMLGHKSIKITQIYAKILDKKVSEDMGMLRSKFGGKGRTQL